MAQQEHFVYVGRNAATATHLHQVLANLLAASPAAAPTAANGHEPHANGAFPLHVLSNQKEALRFVQAHPARLVAVETSPNPASRKRFCDSVRQRAPQACIVAVGAQAPQYAFAFDAVIDTPLHVDDMMRLAGLLRTHAPEAIIRCGAVTLDTQTREVVAPRGRSVMTPKEAALLTLLMRRANQVVPRSEIMLAIWQTDFLDDTRTLDVHIRWVRRKIEVDPGAPTLLVTRRGVGYQFVADGAEYERNCNSETVR